MSVGDKFKVIRDLQRQQQERERLMAERNRPAHFVFLLRDDKMTGKLRTHHLQPHSKVRIAQDWKKIKYNMAELAWQSEFLELFSGLDYIFHHLGKLLLNWRCVHFIMSDSLRNS